MADPYSLTVKWRGTGAVATSLQLKIGCLQKERLGAGDG